MERKRKLTLDTASVRKRHEVLLDDNHELKESIKVYRKDKNSRISVMKEVELLDDAIRILNNELGCDTELETQSLIQQLQEGLDADHSGAFVESSQFTAMSKSPS